MQIYIISEINKNKSIDLDLLKNYVATGTKHLPVVNFKEKTIEYPNFKKLYDALFPKILSFEQKLYKIKHIIGGFMSKDDVSFIDYEPCDINYTINANIMDIDPALKMNHEVYTHSMRYSTEAIIQAVPLKKIAWIGGGFGKFAIAMLQCCKHKCIMNIYQSVEFPLCTKFYDDNDKNHMEYKFKYLNLMSTIANLSDYTDKHDIYLHNI